MPESYLSLPPKDQKEILQSAAIQLGRKENVLEKDVWVCWVLETMFSMPGAHPMAFKGGTFHSPFRLSSGSVLDYSGFLVEADPSHPSKVFLQELSDLNGQYSEVSRYQV